MSAFLLPFNVCFFEKQVVLFIYILALEGQGQPRGVTGLTRGWKEQNYNEKSETSLESLKACSFMVQSQ